VSARHRVLLTGTPLQNSLEELFFLMNFLEPAKFGSLEEFKQAYAALDDKDKVGHLIMCGGAGKRGLRVLFGGTTCASVCMCWCVTVLARSRARAYHMSSCCIACVCMRVSPQVLCVCVCARTCELCVHAHARVYAHLYVCLCGMRACVCACLNECALACVLRVCVCACCLYWHAQLCKCRRVHGD
jgi:hypothetical protein